MRRDVVLHLVGFGLGLGGGLIAHLRPIPVGMRNFGWGWLCLDVLF